MGSALIEQPRPVQIRQWILDRNFPVTLQAPEDSAEDRERHAAQFFIAAVAVDALVEIDLRDGTEFPDAGQIDEMRDLDPVTGGKRE